MKNKISSLLSSGNLVLLFFLVLSDLSQSQEQPLTTRIDHFYAESGQARSLFTFFKDTFQLPESWPFRDAGTHVSGGLWLGNTILEFVTFPHNSDTIVRTGFRGIAFEAAGGADETAAGLNRRGIAHAEVENRMGKGSDEQMRINRSLLDLTDFPPDGTDLFFIDYKFRTSVAGKRKAVEGEMTAKNGGPLGIIGVAEITVGVRDIEEAGSKWGAILSPRPQISDDVFVFESGPRIRLVRSEMPGIRGIILSVRSLNEAEKFLRERDLLERDDAGNLYISSTAIDGLLIQLRPVTEIRR